MKKLLITICIILLPAICFSWVSTQINDEQTDKLEINDDGSTNVVLSTNTPFKNTYFNALLTDNIAGKKNHDGNYFEASHRFIEVADDEHAYFYWTTGSTVSAHVVFELSAEGKSYITGYSSTVVSSSGTLYTRTTKNFKVNRTPACKTYYEPTVTSSGTAVFHDMIMGGTGPKSIGSSKSEAVKWICPASSEFMGIVQNKSGSDKDILIRVFWYEVEE